MALKVVLSETAKSKLSDLLEYLENKWSVRVKKEFVKKLDKTLFRLSNFPQSSPESNEVKGLFKCVLTNQTNIFYRVTKDEIEIVTFFDSRQDPKKIPTIK